MKLYFPHLTYTFLVLARTNYSIVLKTVCLIKIILGIIVQDFSLEMFSQSCDDFFSSLWRPCMRREFEFSIWVLIPFQLLLFAILWKPTPVIHYVCRLGTKVNIISPCLINHPNICRTSHWRILRGAVECISYSVGRWRMCNPIAPQLSLRQVPLLVVWQLLALSEGTVASNHRFCWSVISSHIHIFFFSP